MLASGWLISKFWTSDSDPAWRVSPGPNSEVDSDHGVNGHDHASDNANENDDANDNDIMRKHNKMKPRLLIIT